MKIIGEVLLFMKQHSVFLLKIAVCLFGAPVLALCIIGLPWLANNPVNPEYAHILYPIVIGIYGSVIPFYIALYQTLRILNSIDNNHAFSELSVRALKIIKECAMTFSGMFVFMIPFIYFLADKDDAPGLIIVGMAPIFVSLVIAVFAAVLQRLIKEAIVIKTENDLTV